MISRYEKTTSVVERRVRNSLILVPLKTGPARLDALYTLNETSSFIWNAITPGISQAELVTQLRGEYDVDQKTAEADVQRLLADLTSIGALQAFQPER